jgi:uncharacterized protein (DUF1778 family)
MSKPRVLEPKAERLEVRLTPATKSLLSHAARARHTTLTEFLVSSAVQAAQDTLASPRIFEIESERGWQVLTDLLDAPTESTPNPALVELLRGAGDVRG